jgi:hypothetical protein
MIEPPQKGGVCHLKIDRKILDEARMHKYTQAFQYISEVIVKLLQLRFIYYNIEK